MEITTSGLLTYQHSENGTEHEVNSTSLLMGPPTLNEKRRFKDDDEIIVYPFFLNLSPSSGFRWEVTVNNGNEGLFISDTTLVQTPDIATNVDDKITFAFSE